MSTTEIPPPGTVRDAEIARALGHYLTRDDGSSYEDSIPGCSTDPAACDRLEAELDRRGYEVQVSRIAGYCNVFVRRGADELTAAIANCRPDAVSAAALLALRGGP
jgi:hypothetical protein